MNKKLFIWLPLVCLVLFAVLAYNMLGKDTRKIPSPLVNKALPRFALQQLDNQEMVTDAMIKGEVALINVWASWCTACLAEVKVLQTISDSGVKVYGINYKDKRSKALDWLSREGNPYVLSIEDPTGDFGIDMGVYGVPETFLIDKYGVIRKKWIGEVTESTWQSDIQPMIQKLRS